MPRLVPRLKLENQNSSVCVFGQMYSTDWFWLSRKLLSHFCHPSPSPWTLIQLIRGLEFSLISGQIVTPRLCALDRFHPFIASSYSRLSNSQGNGSVSHSS